MIGRASDRMQRPGRCKGITEVYSRIVGFMRPYNKNHIETNTWNRGKLAEVEDRKNFTIKTNRKPS